MRTLILLDLSCHGSNICLVSHKSLLMAKGTRIIGHPMGFWEQGNKDIYFRGTREQRSKTRVTEEHDKCSFGEQGIQEIGERGNSDLYQKSKGTGILPWEGLRSDPQHMMAFCHDHIWKKNY